MCGGPIRFVSNSNIQGKQEYDDNFTLLLSTDLVIIDEKAPDMGKWNVLDFFFVAQKDIDKTEKGKLLFWFPYTSEGGIQPGSSNEKRAKKHLSFCQYYIEQAIRKRTSPPWSFGWDENRLRAILNLKEKADTVYSLQTYLDQIRAGKFLSEKITVKELHFKGSKDSVHQNFSASLNKDIKKGQIIHIYFTAENAQAVSVMNKPRSGMAPFYYYYNYSPPLPDYPYKKAPIVPCSLLFCGILFPSNLTWFEPEDSFVKDRKVGVGKIIAPSGDPCEDMRWFTMFNAHLGPYDGNFEAKWAFAPYVQKSNFSSASNSPETIAEKGLFFDEACGNFVVDGKKIPQKDLSLTTEILLTYLYRNAGRICTLNQIIDDCWGVPMSDEIVYQSIRRLRKRLDHISLGAGKRYIVTVPRRGYKCNPNG